jgi:hypothetical protein
LPFAALLSDSWQSLGFKLKLKLKLTLTLTIASTALLCLRKNRTAVHGAVFSNEILSW